MHDDHIETLPEIELFSRRLNERNLGSAWAPDVVDRDLRADQRGLAAPSFLEIGQEAGITAADFEQGRRPLAAGRHQLPQARPFTQTIEEPGERTELTIGANVVAVQIAGPERARS